MSSISFQRRERIRKGVKFDYYEWDGTQEVFDYDADSLFSELLDDLAYHGDLNTALRRLMQQGFSDRSGNDLPGLRDMLQRLAERREDLLEQFDLGSVYDQIAEELQEIVDEERTWLQELLEDLQQQQQQFSQQNLNQPDAGQSDTGQESASQPDAGQQDQPGSNQPSQQSPNQQSPGQQNTTQQANDAAQRDLRLQMLPNDLPGRVKELQDYQFASETAAERFEELMERLRQEIANSTFNQMRSAMGAMDEAGLDRSKDMLADLNEMLRQREAGEEPDFEGFMERHGDFFPENPQSLDELLEAMAQRMAGMQAMFNSMSPEQREELSELMDQLLEDMDLRWQLEQLGEQLQKIFPNMGWDDQFEMRGQNPLSMSQATELMSQLSQLDDLSEMMQGAVSPAALSEIDPKRVEELLGDEDAEALRRLGELAKLLEERGLATNESGRMQLTPAALRRIGQLALRDLFDRLMEDRVGQHTVTKTGIGHERDYSTKPYEFGDNFNLNIEQTLRNAISRQGSGTPVRLQMDDFEIEQNEFTSRASTVLMLDLSLSMPMRENFLPAKKVALALHSLISSQFPRDYLGIVGFAETAQELKAAELPEVSWDFAYGTNMHHGFMIARRLLARQSGSKQIIMITDGEPTAHLSPNGAPYFAYPPVPATVEATLAEVARATREDIRINVFMLDPNSYLRAFVEKMTQMNGGRAFFTSPHNLGDYVLVDFLEHRRKLVTSTRW